MDKTSIIGIILALIALSVGMVLKGVSLSALANPAPILIILFGTISAVIIAFPGKEIKKVPALFKVLFKENKQLTIAQLIPMFSQWAQIARREGLLALEASIEDVDDAFLKNGLSMAVDGQSAEFIRDIMTEEVEAMEDRHQAGATYLYTSRHICADTRRFGCGHRPYRGSFQHEQYRGARTCHQCGVCRHPSRDFHRICTMASLRQQTETQIKAGSQTA